MLKKSHKHKKTYKFHKNKSRRKNKYGGAAEELPLKPPSLTRSESCSSILYTDLYNNLVNQTWLDDVFQKDTLIIPELYKLIRTKGHKVTFDINQSVNGIYLNWRDANRIILHVSIHTGIYAPGATLNMVLDCIQKGNMHIKFDLIEDDPEIKLTVNDDLKVSFDMLRPIDDESPKEKIIRRIRKIIMRFIKHVHGN